ncbi:MAG: hypothetical protein Q8J78_06905 [Moraxellaceae bacterium]|nr:hypothetical protein [Moraxellaceae bacterium]
MLIQHTAGIPFPIDDVYSAFLLRMDELPPWLPGIQRIDITRFEKPSAHTAQVDYKWLVQKTVVPSLLRPFLRDNMDHIRSTTRWCAQRRIVEFEFFHDDYREWFDCYGTFALVEAGHNSMRIDIHAELLPYPERVPGLPRWLAQKGLPLIEGVIGDIIKPSLLALPAALQTIVGRPDLMLKGGRS